MHLEALEPRHLLALVPQLLLDVTPGPDGSEIRNVVDVEGTTFFTVEPAQLWKTDGTAGGTVLVKDLGPGSGRTYLYLHNHNGILVFAMKDTGADWPSDDDRVQLWKSDGTTAGTVLVKDFGLGSSWSMSLGAYLTTVDDALFAVVGDVEGGNELWMSDLTQSGTVRVKDIRPGAYGSYPGALTNLNGTLYFSAGDESHGWELWKSDGTEAGTVLLKDICPGPCGSDPFWLTPVDGELLFSAYDEANGIELWKSDGTTAGTVLVKDLRPGSTSSYPRGPALDMYLESWEFVELDGQVFFFADDGAHGQELWKSDDTEAGTVMVRDVNPGPESGADSLFLENADDTLFLNANDETHGRELWKSDGTEAGTVLVKDIYPGTVSSSPFWLSSVGGELFFAAQDETHGQELWRSDGTEAGTALVTDIYPGSVGSYLRLFPTTSAKLFLTADDGIHGTEPFVMVVAGEIRGQKFEDRDGDRRRDPDEPGVDGFTIQLLDPESGDVLQSAVTAGEELDGMPGIDPITERGLYRFEVAPGTYRIHELPQDGWSQSVPLSGDYLITVEAGQVVGTAPAEAPVSAGPGVNWLDEVDSAGNVQFYTTVIVDVDIDFDGAPDAVFDLSGMTNVDFSAAYDTGDDGIGDTVDTEITRLDLHGTAIVGPTDVRLRPGQASLGNAHQSPGETLADTSFDVYLEIDTQGIFGQPLTLHNEDPLPIRSLIDRVPPYGAVFSDTLAEALSLYDEDGGTWAQLLEVTLLPLYGVEFGNTREFDFGDAPDFSPGTGPGDYQTLAAHGGPSHTMADGLFMGGHVDIEKQAWPNTWANGDDGDGALPDDEDGVACPTIDLVLTEGTAPTVSLTVTNTTGSPATLYGWIDYNRDGVFDNSAERAAASVPNGLDGQTVTLAFPTVPFQTAGRAFARFRLALTSDTAAADSTGAAGAGEVEDHAVSIFSRGAGVVREHQKISDTEGNFLGTLDDGDLFGGAVEAIGDLDGDGITDLAVGAHDDDDGGVDRGAVWILFMNADGTVKGHQKISDTEGNFSGTLSDNRYFGPELGALGDLDGDGAPDLAVGAYYDEDEGDFPGAVWILFLNPDGTVKAHQELSETAGNFTGTLHAGDRFGSGLNTLGDLDGDGVPDLVVGAQRDDDGGHDRGAVWILFLNTDGTVKSHQKISDSAGGFAGTLVDEDLFGSGAATLGDLDGDGVGDLAVGARNSDDDGSDRGAVWVLFMNQDGTVKGHQKIGHTWGSFSGTLDVGDRFGTDVAALGDLDGDNVIDLAVGARGDDDGGSGRGAVWVLFLNADGTVKDHRKISDISGNFTGTLDDIDCFGNSVTAPGDLDGDGVIDLAVGAIYDDDGGVDRGAVWVLNLASAPAEIHGQKFDDRDGDGVRDEGEVGLAGWTIYLDQNQNGQLDADEPFTLTEGNGEYAFTDLPAGSYTVAELGQAGWQQTFPPLPEQSVAVPLPGLAGSYFGGSSRTVSYEAGVRFRAISGISLAWTGEITAGLGTGDGVEMPPGWFDWPAQFLATTPPGVFGYRGSVVGGSSYGVPDPFAALTPLTLYPTDPPPESLLDGQDQIRVDLAPLIIIGGQMLVPPSGQIFSAELQLRGKVEFSGRHHVDLAGGQIAADLAFGNFRLVSILGTKFNDCDGDGVKDEGVDQGLANWTIFLDTDNDGALDRSEKRTTTAADGTYSFTNLGPGTYRIREVQQAGWVATLGSAGYTVVAESGVNSAGRDFGNVRETLIVTQFTPTPTGFAAEFNRRLDLSKLNLYDGAEGQLGPSDVVLQDAGGNSVAGSLAVDDSLRTIHFVKTGKPLELSNYTVILRSGSSAFQDQNGNALDGDQDWTPGDDFVSQFTTGVSTERVVSVPDLCRGAGQSVNVPNTGSGLPIRLDNADGIMSLAVDLVYDPDLLAITAATLAAGVPGDWTVVNPPDTSMPGVVKIWASGTTALSGTNVEVVRLTAAVPNDAPYGAVQAIRLDNVALNSGAIGAVGDVAVHKAAYLGDADGSGIHSSADAFLTVQAALGLASGFAAHAWTDPRIVGDADASGVLSAADAFLIVQEGLGLPEPFVPDNPHVAVTPVGGGVDPQFQIDVNLPASADGVVTVPVKLAIEPAATNVGALDFDLLFDPARLTIQVPDGVSAGADTAGWAMTAVLVAPGQLRVGMVSSSGQPLPVGLGEIARLLFRVEAGESRRTGWQPVPDGLPTRPTLLRPITDHRLLIADVLDGSETHPTWLDIEPLDARAGGYIWTDADGSVLIQPAERTLAGATRERVWRDVDAKTDLLDSVLADLVHDVATAWR